VKLELKLIKLGISSRRRRRCLAHLKGLHERTACCRRRRRYVLCNNSGFAFSLSHKLTMSASEHSKVEQADKAGDAFFIKFDCQQAAAATMLWPQFQSTKRTNERDCYHNSCAAH